MLKLLKKLHEDEHGVILSAEIVIVGSILVIGLITGLTCLQHSVNGELKDVAAAIGSLDQSYSFSGQVKPGWNGRCCAFTAGSSFANCESKCETEQSQITGCCNVVAVASVASCCGTCGGRGVAVAVAVAVATVEAATVVAVVRLVQYFLPVRVVSIPVHREFRHRNG